MKHVLLLTLNCLIIFMRAMQPEMADSIVSMPRARIVWHQWVQESKEIKIEHPQLTCTYEIDDDTTILDVKNYLLNREGLPVETQSLKALSKFLVWRDVKSGDLDNGCNVKDVMHCYNVDHLGLSLILQTHEEHANG